MDRNNNNRPYTWQPGQPCLTGRKVYILFKPGQYWQRHVSGVYKITFGHRFYIGRSKLLFNRWQSHNRGINKALREYPNHDEANAGYYGSMLRYLHENPKIKVGYVELLHQCENDYELWCMENKYLQDNKNNPDCFNRAFYAGRPTKEIFPIIQQRIYVHYRWFYNAKWDQEAIEWDEITVKGTIRKRDNIRDGSLELLLLVQQMAESYGIVS